ncbi:MAG: serine protease [Clostridia bacterium]|nr:serine protease [Clostridia bacterium]
MNKIFNHLKNHKTKYIIGLLLVIVLSMSLYIFGNQDNKMEKLSKSVLMLNIYDTKGELFATGSGFVAFENDVLVTNYHVIEEGYKIEAVDEDDVVYSLDRFVAFDKEKDLAILKFSTPTDLKVLKLHNSSKISKGDNIIAIGSPIGLKNTVSKGIISSVRKDKGTEILQITAPISHGSSGGVLLNEKGKVIGVTFAGVEEGQNLNFAIPSNDVSYLYKNKTEEITVQDFFFEQHPDEKYKMSCIKVSIDDVLSGKYDEKDVCVSGWIPSKLRVRNAFRITNNKHLLDYYNEHIPNKEGNSRVNSMREEVLENHIGTVSVQLSGDEGEYLNDGDYVTVYGKVSETVVGDKYLYATIVERN